MALIKYAHIINSFVSTEGSGGFMTNYVYYSVLVVNYDGSRKLVEGKYADILPLIPYIRTPIDELDKLDVLDKLDKLDELENIKATVKEIKQDVNSIIDKKTEYIIDSLYPIPDIFGKNEDEAQVMVKNAGLIPVMAINYPDTVPHHGIVCGYTRSNNNFKEIILDVIHEIPNVTGKEESEAENLLLTEGFEINKTYTCVSDFPSGIILSCTRAEESSMSVTLEISICVVGKTETEAEKILTEKGYEINKTYTFVSDTPTGIILSCTRPTETSMSVTLEINICVVGKTETEAEKILTEKGFNIGKIATCVADYPTGIVISCTKSVKKSMHVILEISALAQGFTYVVGKTETEAEKIITEKGFEINKIYTFVTDTPTGIILSCASPEETSMSVTLEISVMVPDILGLPVKLATELLNRENIEYTTVEEYDDSTGEGKVARWLESGNRQIKLIVSQGKKTRVTEIMKDVTWDNMIGSSGDHYSAKISCDRSRNLIFITLFFTIQAKVKHSLSSVSVMYAGKEEDIPIQETAMNPGEPGKIEFTIHDPIGIVSLPERIKITLPTKYGVLKKEEDIIVFLKPKW